MPTPGAALLGAESRAGPSSRAASGPSTATTTALGARLLPSASATRGAPPLLLTAPAAQLSRIAPAGMRLASWSATAPMPSAGRQFWPARGARKGRLAAGIGSL